MAIHLEIEEWAEVCNRVQRAEAQRDQLREALVAAVNYAPDLGDVPGIQAALKATEEIE